MDLDSEFRTIEKADHCIVLCSREEPYVLNQQADLFLTKSNNIIVYAESIELNGSLKLPGRNLALVCHRLAVTGTSDVVIDVSGANGAPQPAKVVGSGTTGNNGQASGAVFISVESSSVALSRLHVRALGGDGGQGGATSDSSATATGGAGGTGGDAGRITLLINSAARELGQAFEERIIQLGDSPWSDKITAAKEVLSSPTGVIPATSSIEFLAGLGSVLDSVFQEVPESQSASRLLVILRTDLSRFSQLDTYSKLLKVLEANQSVSELKQKLQSTLSGAATKALEQQMLHIFNEQDRLLEDIRGRLSSSPGRGGRGGAASSDLKAGGAQGTDGEPVHQEQRCRYLPAPGDDPYLNLEIPTFFPDEARMLLKRADVHYLTNTEESLGKAADLYQRLLRRLYLVPQFADPAKSSTPLAQLFSVAFEKNNICVAPFSELQGILDEATARFSRIQLGQDMFGQSPIWAPRLSYFYFEKRIAEMIASYKSLAKELNTYQTKSDNADDQREAVGKVRDLVQREGAAVQARLDAIIDDNGPLQAIAYRVRSYDPKMKEQQRHLKTQMQAVADQIKSSINVNKLIDAFTTMASSSSKGEAAKNALKAGYSVYQSFTVVDDAEGGSIDKSLLVEQVTTCGDTLESLTQAVFAGSGGKVALEDPGAVKVVTTKENISKMLDQFRNILPESIRNETNKQLDDFLETVTTRNNAVLEYNALLQSVQELQSIKKQQAAMIEALSQHKLQKVDPGLPSVVNWLRRTRDDLSLTIMQQLNYASRAIRYWGLFEGLPLDKPGPLRGAVELEQIQAKLKQNFDACLTDFAGSTWSWWGSPDSGGHYYKLSKEELAVLIKGGRKDGKGKTAYSVDIPLSPDSPGMAGIGTNVRIRQVRLWLANAYVDTATDDSHRQILTMTLTHTGNESIRKNDAQSFTFTHSPVRIGFRYHCGGVKSLENAKAAAVYGQQIIENDTQIPTVSNANASSIAPLGPFTTWRATIREVDNPGLDLSKVSDGWLEFWGRSKPS